jgi:hypothetical protein
VCLHIFRVFRSGPFGRDAQSSTIKKRHMATKAYGASAGDKPLEPIGIHGREACQR